jgi:hypothetical protein
MSTSAPAFPLGVYLSNPNGSDPAAEAAFETQYNQFTQLMGAAPTFINAYIDQTQPIDDWVANAGWQAWSNASSPDAKTMTPVIALPMTSTAAGSPSADQMYKNFAAGGYDTVISRMVQAWAQSGFTTQYWRPGWEMNLSDMPSYEGNDAATQADWLAAYRHIYTVLHAAGQEYGVNIQVIWNPGITNYSAAGVATQTAYPGNQYVDIIGADVYGDVYPYGEPTALYDWDKSGQVLNSSHPVYDTSLAEWASDPVNLTHYYTDPASTQWSLDGSDGRSLSLQNLIDFAKAQGKPIAITEAGAGNTADGAGVPDNPTFVQWLYDTLTNSGVAVSFVNIWDSNGGGTYQFTSPSDDKPLEAAAWAEYFGARGTAETACFCAGTRILTTRGEVPVECLVVGDNVVTASGSSSPICWIGWRKMDLRNRPDRVLAQPVRISAGSFGSSAPRRDLLVSPEHAVFLGGVLIPARHLVGCVGIAVDETIDRTIYYHVELPRHDVLLAEGLPCESWLDTGNRSMFENGNVIPLAGRGRLAGASTSYPDSCAPLVVDGPVLDTIRQQFGAPHLHHVFIDDIGNHVFAIPAGTGTVRITSKAGYVPGDGRRLGAALRAMVLDGRPIGTGEATLIRGFHDAEEKWRWTDGWAELRIDAADRVRRLCIDVAMLVPAIADAC